MRTIVAQGLLLLTVFACSGNAEQVDVHAISLARIIYLTSASLMITSVSAANDAFLRGSQCTRCLINNCCSDGLKCVADGHDGACTACTGQYEFICGDKCCKDGQECHGNPRSGYSCTIPLFQTAEH